MTDSPNRNANAVGGSLAGDVFQDATSLEEALHEDKEQNSWQQWSFLATDGDMAALAELVSEDKV